MRHFRIFLLFFQDILQERSRAFVWFLISIVNPLVAIIFWHGASLDASRSSQLSLSAISSYYFILLFASSMLLAHIDSDVGYIDILEGRLTSYITKPYSYFWQKFFVEFSYRLLQGVYGIIAFFILTSLYGRLVSVVSDPFQIVVAVVIALLAFFLSFTLKMIVGLSALWFTDFRGFQQFMDVIIWLLSGLIVPLSFYPVNIQRIASWFPFAYMLYHPVQVFQGVYQNGDLFWIIVHQLFWLTIQLMIYQRMWKSGVRRYTGVGE